MDSIYWTNRFKFVFHVTLASNVKKSGWLLCLTFSWKFYLMLFNWSVFNFRSQHGNCFYLLCQKSKTENTKKKMQSLISKNLQWWQLAQKLTWSQRLNRLSHLKLPPTVTQQNFEPSSSGGLLESSVGGKVCWERRRSVWAGIRSSLG